jgi:uncharacterized Zn-binding protein involved in type VI secretion
MPRVQRQGDANSAGGVITSGDSSVMVNGRPIAVENLSVTPHPPCPKPKTHCNAQTKASESSVLVNGKRIILSSDTDTCGHSRSGGSPDVAIG